MTGAASPWWGSLLADLAPTPGRLGKSLRVVLASVVTLLLVMTLRIPFGSLALYFILLTNHASPAVSWRSSLAIFASALVAVVAVLGLTALSGNDPVARLVSVAVVTFVAGVFVHQASLPAIGSVTGLVFLALLPGWELEARPGAVIETNLWILPALGAALASCVAVDFLFASQDPVHRLQAERTRRYALLEAMFASFAAGSSPGDLLPRVRAVEAVAAAGDGEMQSLYASIANRGLPAGSLPPGMPARMAMITRVLDLAAAFGTAHVGLTTERRQTASLRERCARLAQICARQKVDAQPEPLPEPPLPVAIGDLLGRVEAALAEILRMPRAATGAGGADLVYVAADQVPLLPRHAFAQREALVFAGQLSGCAMFCYLTYHAVGWPGISTCVATVLVTALGDTAGTKQRLTFRLGGAVLGGLILGLGSVVFLLPRMDSITPLVLLVAGVSFLSAWVGGGRRLGYLGPQIAYCFYACAMSGFRPALALAPPRDTFVGIAFAAIVMWFVFDHLAPVPTRLVLRRALARTLRSAAQLVLLVDAPFPHRLKIVRGRVLRYEVGKTITQIRVISEVVPYDFGEHRARDLDEARHVVGIAFDVAALFWSELALLYDERELPAPTDARALDRQQVAKGLAALATAMETDASRAAVSQDALTVPESRAVAGYGRVCAGVLRVLAPPANTTTSGTSFAVTAPTSQEIPRS